MVKPKKKSSRQLSQKYVAVMLEDLTDKVQILLEAVQPMPLMQKSIKNLEKNYQTMQNTLEAVVKIVKQIPEMNRKLDTTIEEVANVRVDMAIMKEDIQDIKETVTVHDQKIKSL